MFSKKAPDGAPLSAAQARRIFLNAQSLARSRRAGRVGEAQFGTYLAHQGVLQLDSVNVFARAHYMPFFSRLGVYRTPDLDIYLWGDAHGHSPHTFEHWGHEASVMPRDLLPAMHPRMIHATNWKAHRKARLDAERPGLIGQVREAVNDRGPVVAGALDHLAPRDSPRGSWWDHSHVKDSLEYLFFTGRVAASRGRNFARTYNNPQRGWGRSAADQADWGLDPETAHQQLFERALAACGIGTVRDLADHFRLIGSGAATAVDAHRWAEVAVARRLAEWVTVAGWADPALLAVDSGEDMATPPAWHRPAQDPGRATGAALLSPFDPVCWYRPRLERMFGVEYRIEIYTPAPQRRYGYYCLPFLLGDQIVGRVDLKADRAAAVLRVEAAWVEDQPAPGARRRTEGEVAEALARELRLAARWQGLEDIHVADRGSLATALARALRENS